MPRTTLVAPPTGAQLWIDDRDVAFLREDMTDRAAISVYARNRDYHDVMKGRLKEIAGKTGENVTLRRVARFASSGAVGAYQHFTGKVSALVDETVPVGADLDDHG